MQTPKRVLISAHLPTIKSLWKISSLHDFEQIRTEAFGLRRYTGNAGEHQRTPRWSDFEDGWHVGPCTKPAKLTSGEQERASSFTEFSTRTGLVLANTWGRGKMIGEATKKPWHKSDLLGHTDEDSDTQVVAVKPSSCVQSCEVDHSMDTWAQTLFAAIISLFTCSISTETRAQRRPNRTPCVEDWRPAPEWEDEMKQAWDWTRPRDVRETWRELAAKHQLPHGDRYLQGYEDDLSNLEKALKKSDKHDTDRPHLRRAIWRSKRARRRHVKRQNMLECCEEERAPPGQAKSKHLNWERVFGNSDDPKGLSYFLQRHLRIPTHCQRSDTPTGRGRTSKMVRRFLAHAHSRHTNIQV